MDLKVNTLMTHYVEDGDLQQFLTHHAGTLIEIIDGDNDSDHFFNVNGKFTTQEKADAKWAEAKSNGHISINDMGLVLHHFMYAGEILGGLYCVQVSW